MKTIDHYKGFHDPDIHHPHALTIAEEAREEAEEKYRILHQEISTLNAEHKKLLESYSLDRGIYYALLNDYDELKRTVNSTNYKKFCT